MSTLIIENAVNRATPIAEILELLGEENSIIRPYIGMESVPSAEDFDRLIISGGPGSANELLATSEYRDVKFLIEDCWDLEIPTLGICLGHQMMAIMLGGKVEAFELRTGWNKIELNESGRKHYLFRGCEHAFPVFHFNHDLISELPSGAIELATSPNGDIESFCVPTQRIYGIQCHPEIGPKLGVQILNTAGYNRIANIPESHDESCMTIFNNFCSLK